MRKPLHILGSLFLIGFVFGCAPSGEAPADSVPPGTDTPQDLLLFDTGKDDSAVFNPNRLIDQELFENADFMTAQEIQAFLDNSPYGHTSFLASYQWNGESVAQVVARYSQEYRINPMVILAKIQVESSLVFRSSPSPYHLEVALGCGCPDTGPACAYAPAGFGRQVECAAELFREYLDSIDETGSTISGWAPGRSKLTSEGLSVTPYNSATAALYTYTPWVLTGTGGNWLFWNVFRKFMAHVLADRPNYQWVGSECTSHLSCTYTGGTCMVASPNCYPGADCENIAPASFVSGPPEPTVPLPGLGMCSAPCTLYCDDSTTPYTSTTFCVFVEGSSEPFSVNGEEQGWCMARCEPGLFPDNNGCEEGFFCGPARRANQPEVVKEVCWPNAFAVTPAEEEVAENAEETPESPAESSEESSESESDDSAWTDDEFNG